MSAPYSQTLTLPLSPSHTCSHTPPWLSSNMLFLSHLLFSILTVKLPWHCLVQCTLNMHCPGVKLSSKCVCVELQRRIWGLNGHSLWTAMGRPSTLSFNGLQGLQSKVKWRCACHAAPLPIHTYSEITERSTFCASLGFLFLFDQSAGSHTICCTSMAGNSNGAGVTRVWQQVNSTHL